jgi:hypothetical protein
MTAMSTRAEASSDPGRARVVIFITTSWAEMLAREFLLNLLYVYQKRIVPFWPVHPEIQP